jgi:hypothetical protein
MPNGAQTIIGAPRVRRNKRFRSGKGKNTLSAAAKKEVLAIVKGREASQIELRYFDFNFAIALSAAGTIQPLTPILSGDQIYNRTGNQIDYKSLEIMFETDIPAAGPTSDVFDNVRVIIFEWKDDDGVFVPTKANIVDALFTPVELSIEPLNIDEKGNFRILFDGFHSVNHASVPSLITRKDIALRGKGIYSTGPGSFTGVGMLYLLAWSDSLLTSHPQFSFTSRLRYTEP